MPTSQSSSSKSAIDSTDAAEQNGFVVAMERRKRKESLEGASPETERRQFGNTYSNLSQEGQELAQAIDRYKMQHRRRYITTDEIILVLKELGYRKD